MQEALTNIERHANASEAQVSLVAKGSGLLVSIADNGVGGVRKRVGSLGLQNIADRAGAIGARVNWKRPQQFSTGTLLEVWVPLPKKESIVQVANSCPQS